MNLHDLPATRDDTLNYYRACYPNHVFTRTGPTTITYYHTAAPLDRYTPLEENDYTRLLVSEWIKKGRPR